MTHELDGTLPRGLYEGELQAGLPSGDHYTFPNELDRPRFEILDELAAPA